MLSPRIAEQLGEDLFDVLSVASHPLLVHLPDEEVLSFATVERRILVTLDIGDFAVLDAGWRVSGRIHAAILLVSFAAFPQNRGFVGAVVRSIVQAHGDGRLPEPGQTSFLRRVL